MCEREGKRERGGWGEKGEGGREGEHNIHVDVTYISPCVHVYPVTRPLHSAHPWTIVCQPLRGMQEAHKEMLQHLQVQYVP